jgi:hypothetical protein
VERGRSPRRRVGVVAGVIALTAVLASVTSVGAASAATYHAHDGASLQAAVANADASSGSSMIELAGGVFQPTSTLTISSDVTIIGPSSAPGAKLNGDSVTPFPSDLLLVEAHAKLTLLNVELTTAGGGGTAAALDVFGTLDLESSTVAGNSGPGLLVQPAGNATVRNSTLSNGLDFGVVDAGMASVFNSTVAFNKNGGIFDSGGTLHLTNAIVADNGSSDCSRRATTSDHSLDSDGSCGVGALSRATPLLAMGLLNNGGPTQTHALEAGSPAIGTGDDSNCPVEDQRHFTRPQGRCDIGAYETGAVQGPAGASPGTGVGSGPAAGAWSTLVRVNGHGTLRGARRSPITFSLRAEVGHVHGTLSYSDGAHHVVLRTLSVRSLAFDGPRGVATLHGSSVEMPRKRRVRVTVVLVNHAGHRSLRLQLSSGYRTAGTLLKGSISFTRSAGA